MSNQLSISNIIEELTASNFPAAIHDTCLIIGFERDLSDPPVVPLNISLYNNNELLSEKDFSIDFESSKRNRTLLNIPVLLIAHSGFMKFEVSSNKKKIGTCTIEIS